MPLSLPILVAALASSAAPLPTVERVDLSRYLGTWYEIVRLPFRFEKGCAGVTATYSRGEDGEIQVLNRCRKGSLDGPLKESKGRARAVDPSGAKLEVTFFWPFWGDYWILELGPAYEYVLVGEPDRKYLWILSRTPLLEEDTVQRLLERAKALGFDVSKIERTLQDPRSPAQPVPGSSVPPPAQ